MHDDALIQDVVRLICRIIRRTGLQSRRVALTWHPNPRYDSALNIGSAMPITHKSTGSGREPWYTLTSMHDFANAPLGTLFGVPRMLRICCD
ncbi:hypothetical protein COCCADRAFT_100356 [Bipolaris zeicola 26-R-13]|uniref:Uncharacterized protein n=1 Tax=Cochliobolus carbonum (strain 26-R-13) TaxID=930089 RepID=W6Y2H4_COCC2|nr:uncharacterized protein COCCADRAFT_100356 [Bipolaris zeicola 26-R-13]EUC31820.1 hypothetical protein COCCADRAFT_100356 [Bipolaris zeicola 26-R-13]